MIIKGNEMKCKILTTVAMVVIMYILSLWFFTASYLNIQTGWLCVDLAIYFLPTLIGQSIILDRILKVWKNKTREDNVRQDKGHLTSTEKFARLIFVTLAILLLTLIIFLISMWLFWNLFTVSNFGNIFVLCAKYVFPTETIQAFCLVLLYRIWKQL